MARIDPVVWHEHRLLNALQSLLFLGGMALLLGLLGWVIAGDGGVVVALGSVLVLAFLSPAVSPRLVIALYGARPLDEYEAPFLFRAARALSERAGLPRPPDLYYAPTALLNAFTVGSEGNAVITFTDGILRTLNRRELEAVLAHEIAHIRNRDTWIMGIGDLFTRLTSSLSTMGQLLLVFNLPLLMMGGVHVSWTAILILIFAPVASALLQLALSRTREFDADLGAVALTGDPRALASALIRMERASEGWWKHMLPAGKPLEPSLLRTHPATEERIRRLLELAGERERLGTAP